MRRDIGRRSRVVVMSASDKATGEETMVMIYSAKDIDMETYDISTMTTNGEVTLRASFYHSPREQWPQFCDEARRLLAGTIKAEWVKAQISRVSDGVCVGSVMHCRYD